MISAFEDVVVGDIVKADRDLSTAYSRGGDGIGMITSITDQGSFNIKWSNGNDTINSRKYITKIQVGKKKSRILNLEDDPFGEEEYGYIQENIDNDYDIQIGDIVEIDKNFAVSPDYINYFGRSGGGRGTVINIFKGNPDEYISVRWHNREEGYYKREELNSVKKNRVINLEDDPYGEEIYLTEQIKNEYKIGDTFKYEGPGFFNGLWKLVSKNSDSYKIREINQTKGGFNVNKSVLDDMIKLTLRRESDSNDDPFGEENYKSIRESNIFNMDLDIIINDLDEAQQITEILNSVGIRTVSNTRDQVKWSYNSNKWKFYVPNKNDSGYQMSNISLSHTYITLEELSKYATTRILNFEDDPFGEEDYNIIKESVDINTLRVGDKVFVDKDNLMTADEESKTTCEIFVGMEGIVKSINTNDGNFPIEVMWDGKKGNKCLHSPEELLSETKRKKILNPKDDPFGEDNWGYQIQENNNIELTINDFKVGDFVRINVKIYEPESYERGVGTVMSISDDGVPFPIEVRWDDTMNRDYTPKELILLKNRILNPENDPFGEDTYLENNKYIQENNNIKLTIDDFKVGDPVITNDKNCNFGNSEFGVGLVISITKDASHPFPITVRWDADSIFDYTPDEILVIKKRDYDSENDPFGEEVYLENNKYTMITNFKLFEKQFNPAQGEFFQINYWLTGELVPVKVIKVNPNNTYLVSFDVEGSVARGAPEMVIKNSDIMGPYQPIRNPAGSGFISTNTNMNIQPNTQVNQVSNDMYL